MQLTPGRQKLYDLVKARGTISFPEAANLMGESAEDVGREFSIMRHLELLREHKPRQQVFIALF